MIEASVEFTIPTVEDRKALIGNLQVAMAEAVCDLVDDLEHDERYYRNLYEGREADAAAAEALLDEAVKRQESLERSATRWEREAAAERNLAKKYKHDLAASDKSREYLAGRLTREVVRANKAEALAADRWSWLWFFPVLYFGAALCSAAMLAARKL